MIDGRYFPPNSARALPARLSGSAGELSLSLIGERKTIRPVLEHVSDRLANVPRKLTFADGGVFEPGPEADIDGFLASHRSFFSRLARLEANWKFVAVAALATLALLIGVYRYGIPLAAAGASAVTPASVLAMMDKGSLETVDRVFFSESKLDEQEKARISSLFAELAAHSHQLNPPLRLLFREGGRVGANAFALPGGTIVVTDELVRLAQSDDEVAGVLAHEIGHVEGRHSLKQLYRVLGIGFMIGVIGGDSSQIVDDAVSQAAVLQTLAYSREFEADADRRSVELMLKVKRDPLAFVALLERVTKDLPGAKGTNWLSTHPGTEDRRRRVGEIARQKGWTE